MSFMNRRNVICDHRDPIVTDLFASMQVYWKARPKSKKDLEETEDQTEDNQEPESQDTTSEDSIPTPAPSTPEQKIKAEEDEYLAWTLGGALRPTVSPGSAWSKGEAEQVASPEEEMEDVDRQLALLEYPAFLFQSVCFWNSLKCFGFGGSILHWWIGRSLVSWNPLCFKKIMYQTFSELRPPTEPPIHHSSPINNKQ